MTRVSLTVFAVRMGGACFGSKKTLSVVHPEPPGLAVVPNCMCSSSSTATPVAVATSRVDPSIGVSIADEKRGSAEVRGVSRDADPPVQATKAALGSLMPHIEGDAAR